MASLPKLIRQPVCHVFRRAYIKRRSATTGKYESTWFEITEFVKNWGQAQTQTDGIRVNQFLQNGVTLRVRNDTGAFNQETDLTSLWSGYLNRYRTLIKIEAGYLDSSGNELPTDASLGIFIMDNELILQTETNDVDLQCKAITSPMEEFRADEIVGITTLTASQIVEKIRDSTDGSGNFLFREFITSTNWYIQSTTNIYTNVQSQLPNLSVWELMVKLAEAETFVISPTRTGGIDFRDRNPRTATSQFSLYGHHFDRPNVISVNTTKEALNKLYTNVRLKYLEADTTTSFISDGDPTLIDNSSTSWLYGRRNYEFENLFFNTATAQTVVTGLLAEFSVLKMEAEITTKFIPNIEVLDRIDVSYSTFEIPLNDLWDRENWASTAAVLPDDGLTWNNTGESINWKNKEFKVLSKAHDLDRFTTKLLVREV